MPSATFATASPTRSHPPSARWRRYSTRSGTSSPPPSTTAALQSENAQLRETVGELNGKLSGESYARAAQSSALLGLEHLPFAPNVPQVFTQVISRSTSNFSDAVEVSSGTSSGVGRGMPVVSDGGLVGRVTSEARSTATVGLLTAAGTTIGVEDTANGSIFNVDGAGAGKALNFETTSSTRPPHVGDLLVTSGSDAGAYPPAIPVGKVTSVHAAPGGLNAQVTVSPVAELSQLQYLAVLQWLPPA